MTATEQAAATFARIVQLQDERDCLADALGHVLDENAALKRILAACHLDKDANQSHLDATGAT
jgi:hypothetical protein